MKILVPVEEKNEKTKVFPEFGRAPYFAVVEDGKVSFYENPGALSKGGAGVKAAQFAVDLGVEKVVVKKNPGPNATSALEAAGIGVEVKNVESLEELL